MSIMNCVSCNKQIVAETSHKIEQDAATKGMPALYQCNDCFSGKKKEAPKSIDSLKTISGECHPIKTGFTSEQVNTAVADAQERIKNLQLVSYGESDSLTEQTSFELVITSMWVDHGVIRYIAKILNTPQGKELERKIIESDKFPDVRIRWNLDKESILTNEENQWSERTGVKLIDASGDIPMVQIDMEERDAPKHKRVLTIDSVYIYLSWWNRLKKKLFG